MITKDAVYRKHINCNIIIKRFISTKISQSGVAAYNNGKYRLRCTDHDKWLHTLTDSESAALKQSDPELFED